MNTARRGLIAAVVALSVASIAAQVVIYVLWNHPGYAWPCGCPADFFDASQEGNLPTWFSGLALFACSALLGLLTFSAILRGDRHAPRWALLSVLFLYLSIDELVGIHESLQYSSEMVFFALIPGGLAIAAIAGGYMGFLSSLAPRIRLLFVAAAALYIAGAVVIEGGGRLIHDDVSDFVLGLYDGVLAELLEMAGTAIFIYALLLQLQTLSSSASKRARPRRDPLLHLSPTAAGSSARLEIPYQLMRRAGRSRTKPSIRQGKRRAELEGVNGWRTRRTEPEQTAYRGSNQ